MNGVQKKDGLLLGFILELKICWSITYNIIEFTDLFIYITYKSVSKHAFHTYKNNPKYFLLTDVHFNYYTTKLPFVNWLLKKRKLPFNWKICFILTFL